MPITTFSSREFNQDTGRAKKAAANGPVFITDRGRPAHVLLNIDNYYAMANKAPQSLLDRMESIPGGDSDYDFPQLSDLKLHIPEFE